MSPHQKTLQKLSRKGQNKGLFSTLLPLNRHPLIRNQHLIYPQTRIPSPKPIKAVKELDGYQIGARQREVRIGSVFNGTDVNDQNVKSYLLKNSTLLNLF